MRELKFRAWDIIENKMLLIGDPFEAFYTYDDDGIHFGKLVGFLDENYSNRYKMMQYTGLEDKNGESIFEGDILTYAIPGVFVVKFINGSFDLYDEQMNRPYYPESRKIDYGEVIGNIYENPKLCLNS